MTRPQAVMTAKEMWADGEGGWTITEIRSYLAKHGVDVARATIRTWVNDEWREQERRQQRLRKRERRGSTYFHILDDDAKERLGVAFDPPTRVTSDLLLALRQEDCLTYTAISAVARRFLGEDMTPLEVRFRLYELGVLKNPNKVRVTTKQHELRKAA